MKAILSDAVLSEMKRQISILEKAIKDLVNFKNYYNQVSNCSNGEKGAKGNKAGDKGGKEWYIGKWSNKSWNYVLRYPDKEVRECIAWLSIMAAKNDNIGYDQGDRTSYWTQLKKVKYDPSKIKTKCEADCSSAVSSNVKATGYLLSIAALKNVSINTTTSSLKTNLQKAGFKVYSAKKYLTSSAYLIPGDILLHVDHHTEVNLGIGSKTGYKCLYEQTQLSLKTLKTEYDQQMKLKASVKTNSTTSTKVVTGVISTTGNLISGATISGGSSPSGVGTNAASNSIANTASNNLTGISFSKDAQTTNSVAVIGI